MMDKTKTSPKKNFIYNLIYQILILIIPLITAPYLSRVVGAEGVGTYSYTYSIVYYFMLLTLLGINNYGNRSIAKVREDKEKLSTTFWGIYLFQLLMGTIMLAAYKGYLCIFNNEHQDIALIETLFVVSAMLDINWLFFGLEEFKKTITRNIFVKILSVVLIFTFVKDANDLWKYTLIMAGTTVLSQVLMWFFVKKKIKFTKITLADIKKHIKPNLVLFIPVIAVSLYKMMDKIMLGRLANVTEVGYYENAEKIVNIPVTLITALGTVMLPRISNMTSRGDNDKIKEYISKSINFVMFMSWVMCFGLIAIGKNFAPFYFGGEFQKTGILIMLLALTLPFLSFANVLRTQYLIPLERDKIYIISVSLGAISNLIMNLIFIPKFGSMGACIGTIVAEAVVMIYQSIAVKNDLPIGKYIVNILPFLWKATVMLICIYPLNYTPISPVWRLFLQVLIGAIVYCVLNYQYIRAVIHLEEKINNLRRGKSMEEEIDLKELFDTFWKKKTIIILVTIVFAVIGVGYAKYFVTPKYKSATTLLLAQNNSQGIEDEINEITQTDIMLNQKLVSTYGVLVKSKNVIGQVLTNLNMQSMNEEELKENITVKAVEDTQVIEITYVNEEPRIAYLITSELANVFSEKVVEIYNINNVYIVDKAELETEPYNVNPIKDIALFAIAGFGLSCAVIFVFSLFDTTVKTQDDVEKKTGLSVLAQIPAVKIGGKEDE